ncbi:MAG: flagellar FliJ family protein [Bacteriovoracaceae bacterium]|nr:flagellar FliJ family protein [Bacteriovoracaceae bacterium]
MKKFDFKLKGLLKIREARESVVKSELGEILRQKNMLTSEIEKINNDITDAYHSQEKLMEDSIDAQFLNFYPYFIQGKKDHIKVNEVKIYGLDKQYQEKLKELHDAKANVHVIETLKDKAQTKHKKEVDKKLQEILDESSIRKEYMKRMNKEGM